MAKVQQRTITLEEDNLFLTYPRDMMMDINDKHHDSITDYDINENNLTLEITENGIKHLKEIKKLIEEM